MASRESNVVVKHGDHDPLNLLMLDVGSSTTVGFGDLIESTSGAAVAVDAAGDNATFAGVALDASESGETAKLRILTHGIVQLTVVSTTYDIGDALKYSSGANGTAWVLTKATTGADGIMWSRQYKSSAVTTLECHFNSQLVVTETAGGGLWETLAA
ncbi:MAG: hypothetical protein PHC29_08620 [Candidatus Omnitrophica bacterium]|nr:hypothetical protein [Candidatus Omnitrophota bacterium]